MTPKEQSQISKDKYVIKLMEMAKEAGIKKERERIVKLFDYEIHNNFVNFETLKKLVGLKGEENNAQRLLE
jgi:hypothetical protein